MTPAPGTADMLGVLEKTLGYSSFRGQQGEIIQTVIDAGDASFRDHCPSFGPARA